MADASNPGENKPGADVPAPPKSGGRTPDLLVRFVSAVAMLGIAIIALYLGGWVWIGFVVLIGGLVLWEWNLLVRGFGVSDLAQVAWQFVGALYVGAAALAMMQVRFDFDMWTVFFTYLAPVIAVDVGAYFAGRLIGGHKIATGDRDGVRQRIVVVEGQIRGEGVVIVSYYFELR